MPYFGQDLFIKAQAKGPLTEKEYVKALEKGHKLARIEGIDALMDKHKLDAIVAPTAGPSCLTDLLNGDHFTGGSSNAARSRSVPTSMCRRDSSTECRWESRFSAGRGASRR